MGKLAASISHEVTQPITAGITYVEAALHWLGSQPPKVEEAREALELAVKEGERAINIVSGIRALIKKAPLRKSAFEINEALREIIGLTHGEVVKNNVSV